jgi:hypothetical protein
MLAEPVTAAPAAAKERGVKLGQGKVAARRIFVATGREPSRAFAIFLACLTVS